MEDSTSLRTHARKPHLTLIAAVLTASLWGCTSGSGGLLKLGKLAPTAPQAPVVPAGSLIGNNASTLVGVARVPSAQLIANHGAGLIGNNSSGVIGNNGSALIGNNTAGFRIAAASDWVPLEGALITVTDAAGRPLSDARVMTDAEGRFTVPDLKPSTTAMFVRASRTQGAFTLTLLSIANAPETPGEVRIELDPVTTLVAKKTARLVETGAVKAEALNPAAIAEIAETVESALTDRDLAAAVLQDETAAEKTFDALLASHPTLKKEIGDVAAATQAPETGSSPTPTPTPRRSGGGSSGGGGRAPAPTASADTSVSTVGLHTLVRVAGDDVGTLTLGTSPLTAGLGQVNGLALGPDGTLYVADGRYNHIRALPPGAPSTVVAGAADGGSGPTQSSIPATSARFRTPVGLLFDATRQALVVCDSDNNRLRVFSPGGRIYTLAGGGSNSGASVSNAQSASLDTPWGLAADAAGNLYFSERGSGRVRKLSTSGALTTIATLTPGTVGAIAVDPARQCLWVADGDTVKAVSDLGGTPTLLADATFSATGTSPGRRIAGLACDQAGLLYVLQTGTTPAGRIDTRLWRLGVDATGAARADRTAEAIAGTGAESALASDYSAATTPLADARDQLLAAAGECGLLVDLAAGAEADTLSGQIYLGHSLDDGASRWGQVLRLEAAE